MRMTTAPDGQKTWNLYLSNRPPNIKKVEGLIGKVGYMAFLAAN